MSISLLNFGMLMGLVGIAIPIAVHLLNRRRFDVVEWGAMQFLQLGERTRQRIKLSDLLLLLLRMLMIAALVFAFSRPFVQGNTWVRSIHPEPIDLVIILDGSYSMGWAGDAVPPHARAIQSCHEILDSLTGVDRVAIIDARDRPYLLTPTPLTDTATARLELDKLQRPDGAADLTAALVQACQLLTQSFSTRRDIVVITDKQASSWQSAQDPAWNDFLKLRQAAAVPIGLSAIDVGDQRIAAPENVQVNQLQLSRELAVTNQNVEVSTRVKYVGNQGEKECEVFWSVDGQQLSRETETLRLRPNEEAVVRFNTRFSTPGPHTIAASVASDNLPGDDQSLALVEVLEEIPVLIVNTRSGNGPGSSAAATRFLKFGFGDPDKGKVWVNASNLPPTELNENRLAQARMLFMLGSDATSLDWDLLTKFLTDGGTICWLPDTASTPAEWKQIAENWVWQESPLFPVVAEERIEESLEAESPEKFDLTTFTGPWLTRFKNSDKTDLSDVLVQIHWRLGLPEAPAPPKNQKETEIPLTSPVIDARLQSGDPLFVRRAVGRGQIIVSAIPLDGVGSTLVQQRSFVPFLHELVFGSTRTTSNRNVTLGQPLVLRQLSCQPLSIPVTGPDETPLVAERSGSSQQIHWILPPPKLSGIYEFKADCAQPSTAIPGQLQTPFSVFAARGESDLRRLTAEDLQRLEETFGLTWKRNSSEMMTALASSSGGIEIWPFLLFLVTGFLLLELYMTRRLVQGGHHQIESVPAGIN